MPGKICPYVLYNGLSVICIDGKFTLSDKQIESVIDSAVFKGENPDDVRMLLNMLKDGIPDETCAKWDETCKCMMD